jgi:hypothetical protein
MLQVMVHEDDAFCRLELPSWLAGRWVLESEYAWRSALRSAVQIELDMRHSTDFDDAGRELLLLVPLDGFASSRRACG